MFYAGLRGGRRSRHQANHLASGHMAPPCAHPTTDGPIIGSWPCRNGCSGGPCPQPKEPRPPRSLARRPIHLATPAPKAAALPATTDLAVPSLPQRVPQMIPGTRAVAPTCGITAQGIYETLNKLVHERWKRSLMRWAPLIAFHRDVELICSRSALVGPDCIGVGQTIGQTLRVLGCSGRVRRTLFV